MMQDEAIESFIEEDPYAIAETIVTSGEISETDYKM